jgi:hypothetical protein
MMNCKCRTKRANERTDGVIQLLCVDGEKKKIAKECNEMASQLES